MTYPHLLNKHQIIGNLKTGSNLGVKSARLFIKTGLNFNSSVSLWPNLVLNSAVLMVLSPGELNGLIYYKLLYTAHWYHYALKHADIPVIYVDFPNI